MFECSSGYACFKASKIWKNWNAVELDHSALVEQLIERGVDMECKDQFGDTPLLCSAINCLKFLIEKKANIEASGHFDRTSLHDAASIEETRAYWTLKRTNMKSWK